MDRLYIMYGQRQIQELTGTFKVIKLNFLFDNSANLKPEKIICAQYFQVG